MLKKMLFVFGVVVLLVFGCTNCSRPLEVEDNDTEKKGESTEQSSDDLKDETIKIGVSVTDLSNPYFVQVTNGMKKAAEEKGIKVIFDDPKSNVEKQVTGLENFIAQNVDVIVACALDEKAVNQVCLRAQEQGIKVIGQSIELECNDIYVSADNWDMGHCIGVEAGKWIQEKLGGEGEYAILDWPKMPQMLDRVQGIEDGVKEIAPDAECVAKQPAMTPEAGMQVVEALLQAHPNLKVIIGHNDAGAIGALSAVEAAGKDTEDFFIGGIDATPEAVSKIAKGTVYRSTVDIVPFHNGEIDVDLAIKLVNGEELPEIYNVETKAVNADNVNEYVE